MDSLPDEECDARALALGFTAEALGLDDSDDERAGERVGCCVAVPRALSDADIDIDSVTEIDVECVCVRVAEGETLMGGDPDGDALSVAVSDVAPVGRAIPVCESVCGGVRVPVPAPDLVGDVLDVYT